MTCRRLIMAACVAMAALGVAWWMFTDRLTAEERWLLDRWSIKPGGGDYRAWTFRPDRRMTAEGFFKAPGIAPQVTRWFGESCWAAGPDMLVLDSEQNAVRRAIRPFLQLLGVSVGEKWLLNVESLTVDQMIVVEEDGARETWTRDRGDRAPEPPINE
jgi:hypothetical protein